MKNPYALYHLDELGSKSQVVMSKNVQRAITSVLTGLVNLAQNTGLNQWIVEDAGKRILKIKNLRVVGALDTASRESIYLHFKSRLEKESKLDEKEAEKYADKLYQVL